MKMKQMVWLAVATVGLGATANAGTITFDQDPFAGSTALETPGRQVVGNELFTEFDVTQNSFQFDEAVFGVKQLNFANGEIGSIPSAGTNIAVLRTFDNDADPTTPFGAGNAATLLANQITTSGAGFFVYFNQGLDLARLVFSTDLSDANADLKVLARFTNFTGQAGRDLMADITSSNFSVREASPVPVPGTFLLFGLGLTAMGFLSRKRAKGDTSSLGHAAAA